MIVMDDGHEQVACQTLPNILLSYASLVTKSYIARFCNDDACKPSDLSGCGAGHSSSMAHAKSALSPFRANAGRPRPGLFSRFRSIFGQTVKHSRKINASVKDYLSMFFLNQLSCPSALDGSDSFFNAFVKSFAFFSTFTGPCGWKRCHRLYKVWLAPRPTRSRVRPA